MRRKVWPGMAAALLVCGFAGPLWAEETCAKRTRTADFVAAGSLECQFDQLFAEELARLGITAPDMLLTSVYSDSAYAFQTNPDDWLGPFAPAVAYDIIYRLDADESRRLDDLIRYAPGYFGPMQARITAAARPLLCAAMPENLRDFMRLGGHVTFQISLSPTPVSSQTPWTYMTTTIFVAQCEAP